MLVCLACYENRIAALLETANHLRIYELRQGRASLSADLPAPGGGPRSLAGLLGSLGVETLVCGGLDGTWERTLRDGGIVPRAWVGGEVDQVLAALEQGRIKAGKGGVGRALPGTERTGPDRAG